MSPPLRPSPADLVLPAAGLRGGCLKADLLRSPLGSHFRVHAAAAGSKEPTRSLECACGLPFAPSGWWRGYVFTQESTNDRHERTDLVHHNDLLLPSVSGCISHGQSRFVRTSGWFCHWPFQGQRSKSSTPYIFFVRNFEVKKLVFHSPVSSWDIALIPPGPQPRSVFPLISENHSTIVTHTHTHTHTHTVHPATRSPCPLPGPTFEASFLTI